MIKWFRLGPKNDNIHFLGTEVVLYRVKKIKISGKRSLHDENETY